MTQEKNGVGGVSFSEVTDFLTSCERGIDESNAFLRVWNPFGHHDLSPLFALRRGLRAYSGSPTPDLRVTNAALYATELSRRAEQ